MYFRKEELVQEWREVFANGSDVLLRLSMTNFKIKLTVEIKIDDYLNQGAKKNPIELAFMLTPKRNKTIQFHLARQQSCL